MHIWPEEGKHIDLYMIDSNGENLTQITDFAGDENFPQWSGDGTKILFVYNFIEEELEAGKEELGSDGIWVYKLESGTFEFFEGTENGTFPMWRP